MWRGGFPPWFNRTVMAGTDEYPIIRRAGFGINVGLGWASAWPARWSDGSIAATTAASTVAGVGYSTSRRVRIGVMSSR